MSKVYDITETRCNDLIGTMFSVFDNFYYPIAVRSVLYTEYHTDSYHHHDFPQVWYCLSGKYLHIVDGIEYECTPGSLILVPPGSRHAYAVTGETQTELICLEGTFYFFTGMNEPYLTNILTNMFCQHFKDELEFSLSNYLQLCGEEKKTAEVLLLSLCKEDYKRKIVDIASVRNKIGKFFSLPSFELDAAKRRSASSFIKNKLTPMMESIAYMNKNYSKKIHREELIKISTLCQTDFFRLIKKIVGSTYSIYLQMIRLRRAQTMITFSTFSFTYIADKCGFGNRTYMGKIFKKYYGITMSEDRAMRDQHIAEFPYMIVTHEFWDKMQIE